MAEKLKSHKDNERESHGSGNRPITKYDLEKLENKIMAAIDELNAALSADIAAVTALIVAYNTPTASEAQIAAVTTALNAQTAAVQAVLVPVVPPPTPTP